MVDQKIAKKDWEKQRSEYFLLGAEPPEEPPQWIPLPGESYPGIQERVLRWADESDNDLHRILLVLLNNYPNDLALPQTADLADANLSETFHQRIDHLVALGLITKSDDELPRVRVIDALFAPYLRAKRC